MRIAVIGAGNVGATLGRGWTRRRHQVTYGVRDPHGEKACAVAAKLATDLGFDAVSAGPLRNARLLEPLALLWINLAMEQIAGRGACGPSCRGI